MVAGALVGAVPGAAAASPAGHWTRVATPNPSSGDNGLLGVAVVSPHLAWAVGGSAAGSLIMRWDGAWWKQQPSFNPHDPYSHAGFYDVAATSPVNGWAVGIVANGL